MKVVFRSRLPQGAESVANTNAVIGNVLAGLEYSDFLLPLWVLFYIDHFGFSLLAAITLGLTWDISAAVFDIPTGALADRLGRLKIYRIGMLGRCMSYLPFFFTANYSVLLAVSVVGGLFSALTSGSILPVVHESMKKYTPGVAEAKYSKFLGRESAARYVGRFISGIVGAIVYKSHPYGPLLLFVIVLLLAFFVSFLMVDVVPQEKPVLSNNRHIMEGARFVWKHIELRKLYIGMILSMIVTEPLWILFQPIFRQQGIKLELMGIIYGVIAVSSAVGSLFYRRISHMLSGNDVNILIAVVWLLSTAAISLKVPQLTWLVLAACGFVVGFFDPNVNSLAAKYGCSKFHSTILSIQSFLIVAAYCLASLLGAFYANKFGIETGLRIIMVQSICALAAIIFLKRKKA
jgi:MFS family permease